MAEQTLLLVDGSSYLYRAFHALPDLRNPDGEPTGAIYGMAAMLRRLRTDSKLGPPAQYAAVVFDAPGKTFRDDLYPAYKAQRKSMPEDLARQIEPIHRMVRALGWPLIMVAGVEADDVIGTLARKASARGLRTLISSGDKDLAQLVDERITVVNTMTRDNAPPEPLDPAGVTARFGVAPDRIVDYLALVGDSVDNVPGVEKVGPKTAVKWLNEFGSLEAIMAQADRIGGVVGDNLRKALDWLPTARELVTIRTDCDLGGACSAMPGSLTFGKEALDELQAFFAHYGMRTLLRETEEKQRATREGAVIVAQPAGPAPVYETVLDEVALSAWIERIGRAALVAFDTETTSLDPLQAELVGLSLSVERGHACYVPLAHRYMGVPQQLSREAVLGRLKPWLEDPARPKVGQNLKYDSHVLQNHGIRLAGIAHDTLLESYVLEAHRSHGMDALAQRHLNRETLTYESVAGKGASQLRFDEVDIERATRYAAEDAEVTLALHETLFPRIQADSRLLDVYARIELPTAVVLQKMERQGILVDVALLQRQSVELGGRMAALERKAHELAGVAFNLNSPRQLADLLFGQLKLPVVKKTASGVPSTDEEVLEKLAQDYPLPKLLLEYRSLAKLKSTYTDKLPRMVNARTGRVHTSYSQAVAVTGRLASSEPNLQNIPIRTPEGRRIREAFIAPPGSWVVSADYSQIELRIMAHISGDENLLAAFGRGEDIHRATAAEIFGVDPQAVDPEQRRYAKTINFGLIYGMSAFGLASQLGIDRNAARLYIDRYFARYPAVARYMETTREAARAQGYVETVFGRRLWLAEINSPNGPRRAAAERAAINAPMQGTAADIVKLAMIAVQDWIEQAGLATRLMLQVHDELVLEVPDAERSQVCAALPGLMGGVARLKVPLLVEVGAGPNWDRAH